MAIVTDRMGRAKGRVASRTKAEIETSPERPKALRVEPEGIPAELRELDQWVAWRYEWREDKQGTGKWTKVPIDPKTGRLAKSTDPVTWGTFQQALAYHQSGKADGIGFVFTPDDPFAGVDLDDCRNTETREQEPWAAKIVAGLKSYAEVSPSGTGVKVLLRGKVPPGGNRKGKVEMYDRGRYFAVTGRKTAHTPAVIHQRPKALARLHARLFPAPAAKPSGNGEQLHQGASCPPTNGQPFGLTDAEVIRKAQAAGNGNKFSKLWDGDISGYESQSEAVLALCGMLAFWTRGDRGQIDRLFRQSGLHSGNWVEKWERLGPATIAKALEGRTEFYKPPSTAVRDGDKDAQGEGGGKKSQATLLVDLVLNSGVELWHCPDREAYATLPASEHNATGRIRSSWFREWACHQFYLCHGRTPGSQAVQDAINTLGGKAKFEGPEHPVHVRLAEHEGKIYLDLCNDGWQAVEIDSDGWRVVNGPPVKFRRAKAMLPLPTPVPGGSLAELLPFLNVSKRDRPLVLAWVAAALRPTGPFPLLCLHGEQGSAKSTTARLLRSLIDPNTAPVRAEPREGRDLAIAASNGWTIVLDNVSWLPPWLSDALCRLSTGGGFATRTLYENDEETIFSAQRPVIINGITEVAERADLLDRSLLVCLPAIPEDRRKTEKQLWADFDAARPRILGALLDAVAAGLRNLPTVELGQLPRMADFAEWAVACEPALGLKVGAFLKCYQRNRDTANEVALESNPLAKHLLRLVEEGEPWEGTVGDLLEALGRWAPESETRLRIWPKTPRGLSGILRRLAPNLRQAGIAVAFSAKPTERGRMVRLERSREQPSAPS